MTTEISSQDRAAYSVAEAAVLAGVGRDKLYAAIKDGSLDARKWGRRTIIPAASLERFLANLPPLRLPGA